MPVEKFQMICKIYNNICAKILFSSSAWSRRDPSPPLPTVGYHSIGARSPHLASIPHLLSADQQPTSFAICLSASEPVSRHLIGNRGRHHSASSTLVKPLSSVSLFSIGCLWQSAELKGSHMPAGGYVQVRAGTSRYFQALPGTSSTSSYMWVHVSVCGWVLIARGEGPLASWCLSTACNRSTASFASSPPLRHRDNVLKVNCWSLALYMSSVHEIDVTQKRRILPLKLKLINFKRFLLCSLDVFLAPEVIGVFNISSISTCFFCFDLTLWS